jgi:hypothetical protein
VFVARMRKVWNTCRIFVEKPLGNCSLILIRRRQMGNIKVCKCLRVITLGVKDRLNWLSIIFTGKLFY